MLVATEDPTTRQEIYVSQEKVRAARKAREELFEAQRNGNEEEIKKNKDLLEQIFRNY